MLAAIRIGTMDQSQAQEVAAWSYPGAYAFHDFSADADDLAGLLDPVRRRGRYFAATLDGGEVVGFVELSPAGGDAIEIGLGLRPDRIGRGLGLGFVTQVCDWAARRSGAQRLVLGGAAFNARAITVYERAGFIHAGTELVATNGTRVRFVRMEREVSR